MWFFATNFKHRQIIYCQKAFFVMSMHSRSFPQNKVSFGSNLLASFCFCTKMCVDDSCTFVRMEGTISKRKLRWTSWDPEPPSKLAIGRCSTVVNTWLCTRRTRVATTATELGPRVLAHSECTWPARAFKRWLEMVDQACAELESKKEKGRDLEREGRVKEREKLGEKEVVLERGGTVGGRRFWWLTEKKAAGREPQEEEMREKSDRVCTGCLEVALMCKILPCKFYY